MNWPTKEVRRSDNIDFIHFSVYEDQYTKDTWLIPYLTFWIYCCSLVLWAFSAMSDQGQPICYSYNSFRRYWTFRNLQSAWSRASWAVTQEHEFCQACNLGWEVKYHNSRSRLFSGNSWHKIKKIKNKKCPIFKSFYQ